MPEPIDMLYVVRERVLNFNFRARFRASLASAMAVRGLGRICVADTSSVPVARIVSVALRGRPFRYVYCPHPEGAYNRSWNINLGFRELVRSDAFLISDVDMVWNPNTLHAMRPLFEAERPVMVPRWRQAEPGIRTGDYEKARACDGDFVRTSGCFLIGSAFFERMHGFDERFKGWGKEDDNWLDRIRQVDDVAGPAAESTGVAVHLWHKHRAGVVPEATAANEALRNGVRAKLQAGKLKPDYPNSKGWGLVCA